MNLLDLLLVLAAAGCAVSGFRQGLVLGALSMAGFIGGAALGLWALPMLLRGVERGTALSMILGLAIVLIPAAVGNALFGRLGVALRRRLTFAPVRWVDGTGGAVLGVGAMLVVAWMLAGVLASAPLPALATQIRGSAVLGGVGNAMPEQAPTWFTRAAGAIGGTGFPQVFQPFQREPGSAPDPTTQEGPAKVTDAARTASVRSTVKVTGNAPACSTAREGSGFVYAAKRVMTNAHVVAGVSDPVVQVGGGGRQYRATVVLYDPKTDVAVLRVPDLRAPALHFAGGAADGAGSVVSGYPENGDLTLGGARVAGRVRANGQDVYGDSMVTRDIYTLRARVRPGNSGGPLLTPGGRVYGVVFARSTTDSQTGYALTAAQVKADAARGNAAVSPVGTGGCTPG